MLRKTLVSVGTLLAIVALAACGSSSSSSSSTSSAAAAGSSSSSSAATGATSSTASAAASTGKVCAKKETVGIVDLIAESPIDAKSDAMAELASKDLGWTYHFIDAAGDPNKMEQAVQSFVNEHVNLIIDVSIDAAPIRVGLQAAKAAHIPVFEVNSGNQPSSLLNAAYAENETEMGKILADYIVKTVPSAQIGDLATNLSYAGILRENAVKASVAASGGKAHIAADEQVDLTNPVVNTEKTLTDELTGHPNINAVYAVYDNMAVAAASAIRTKQSKAKLYTYFTSASNLNLMRKGEIAAVADANLPFGVVVGIDQFLKYAKSGTAFDPNALHKAGGLTYRIVTSPQEVFTNQGTLAPYLAKWAKEYPCG
jgi:ABC-type sugar transport system substrate-binding protein